MTNNLGYFKSWFLRSVCLGIVTGNIILLLGFFYYNSLYKIYVNPYTPNNDHSCGIYGKYLRSSTGTLMLGSLVPYSARLDLNQYGISSIDITYFLCIDGQKVISYAVVNNDIKKSIELTFKVFRKSDFFQYVLLICIIVLFYPSYKLVKKIGREKS